MRRQHPVSWVPLRLSQLLILDFGSMKNSRVDSCHDLYFASELDSGSGFDSAIGYSSALDSSSATDFDSTTVQHFHPSTSQSVVDSSQ